MNDLISCPFCGNTPDLLFNDSILSCQCGIVKTGKRENLIKWWNTRFQAPKEIVTVKRGSTYRDGGTESYDVISAPKNWPYGKSIIKYRGFTKAFARFREQFMSDFPDEGGVLIDTSKYSIVKA